MTPERAYAWPPLLWAIFFARLIKRLHIWGPMKVPYNPSFRNGALAAGRWVIFRIRGVRRIKQDEPQNGRCNVIKNGIVERKQTHVYFAHVAEMLWVKQRHDITTSLAKQFALLRSLYKFYIGCLFPSSCGYMKCKWGSVCFGWVKVYW